jgi:nicotinamidase-related amidase
MDTIPAQPHPFPWEPQQTALLIIDMQRDFCDPLGYCGKTLGLDLVLVQQIVPRIQRLLAWARQQGMTILYTRESHAPDGSDLSASKRQRYINAGYPVGSLGSLGKFLIRGEPGTEILAELTPLETEIVIDKPAQSAFIDTDLASILSQKKITHLLFTGVTTECCVLATYRQASDLGLFCLLLADCCAAFAPEEQAAALTVIMAENGAIGWVGKSEDILASESIPT